jgi:hypothetical protein
MNLRQDTQTTTQDTVQALSGRADNHVKAGRPAAPDAPGGWLAAKFLFGLTVGPYYLAARFTPPPALRQY